MRSKAKSLALTLIGLVIIAGCSTAPKTDHGREVLIDEANLTIRKFKFSDPDIVRFFENSAGYAVFPSVGKGGIGLGGAYGRGVLYEKGAVTGYCDLTQATIGFQLGGQAYREIIFFENAQTLMNFKSETFALSAQASAVAAKAGAAAVAKYERGVAIFIDGEAGLMAEASVGGQKFNFLQK